MFLWIHPNFVPLYPEIKKATKVKFQHYDIFASTFCLYFRKLGEYKETHCTGCTESSAPRNPFLTKKYITQSIPVLSFRNFLYAFFTYLGIFILRKGHSQHRCRHPRLILSSCGNKTILLFFVLVWWQLSEAFRAETFLGQLHSLPNHFAQVTSICLLYTSPSPRDLSTSRMPSSA